MQFEKFLKSLDDDDIIFALDTNVLLGLYEMSEEYGNELLDILEVLEAANRLRISPVSLKEYEKNKRKSKKHIISEFKEYSKERPQKEDKMSGLIYRYQLHAKKHKLDSKIKAADEAILVFEDLRDKLDKMFEQGQGNAIPLLTNNYTNRIEAFVQSLKQNGVSLFKEVTTTKQLLERCIEGELRYSLDFPPGYKDKEKNKEKVKNEFVPNLDKFNDLFIWKDIVESELHKDVILITGDMKEDWWVIPDSLNLLGYRARPELIKEFKEHNDDYQIDFLGWELFRAFVLGKSDVNEKRIESLLRVNSSMYIEKSSIEDRLREILMIKIENTVNDDSSYAMGEHMLSIEVEEDFLPKVAEGEFIDYDSENKIGTFRVTIEGSTTVHVGGGWDDVVYNNYNWDISYEATFDLEIIPSVDVAEINADDIKFSPDSIELEVEGSTLGRLLTFNITHEELHESHDYDEEQMMELYEEQAMQDRMIEAAEYAKDDRRE